jgi:hypothetical protein
LLPQAVSVEEGGVEEAHVLSRMENFAVRGIRLLLAQRDEEARAAGAGKM